jgi:hypothetical protein
MEYTPPAPRPVKQIVKQEPMRIYVQVDEAPLLPPVQEKEEVVTVEGRG